MASPFEVGVSRVSEYITALTVYDAFDHGEANEDALDYHHHCLAFHRICKNAGGGWSFTELWDLVMKESKQSGRQISATLIKEVAHPPLGIDDEAEEDPAPPLRLRGGGPNDAPRAEEIRVEGRRPRESVAEQIRRLQLELSEARAAIAEKDALIAMLRRTKHVLSSPRRKRRRLPFAD